MISRNSRWLSPGTIALSLGFIAFAIRLLFLFNNQHLTFATSVVGVPFSDAREWDFLAESLLSGHGLRGSWSAQRPLYPVFIASLYLWAGYSPAVIQIAQALLSALTVAGVFLIGTRCFSALTGLLVACLLLYDLSYSVYCSLIMSETLGLFLTVISAWCIVDALETRKKSSSFWAGALLGLSNLTRPLTVLAAPALLLLFFILRTPHDRPAKPRWHGAALFTLGVALTLLPWLIRQQVTHGIFTLTNKTAESFYAATDPQLGAWNLAIDKMALDDGIGSGVKERYSYFMAKAFDNLRTQPKVYISRFLESLRDYLLSTQGHWTLLRYAALLLIVFVYISVLWRPELHAKRITLGMLGLVFALCTVLLSPTSVSWLVVFGALITPTLFRRPAIVALSVLFFFTGVGLALVHEGLNERFLLLTNWLSFLFVLGLYDSLIRRGGLLPYESCRITLSHLRLPIYAALLFFVVSGSWLLYRNTLAATEPPAPPPLTTSWREEATALLPSELSLARPVSVSEVNTASDSVNNGALLFATALLDRRAYALPPHAQVSLNARIFEARPYPRTVYYATLEGGETAYGIIPARIPTGFYDQPVVIIGRLNTNSDFAYTESRRILETLLIIPIDSANGKLQRERAILATNPAHLSFLKFLSKQ